MEIKLDMELNPRVCLHVRIYVYICALQGHLACVDTL